MLEFYVKDGPPRQVVCADAAGYAFLWPLFFARAVPAARLLSRWAARRGAAVRAPLRLRMTAEGGCRVVATRAIPAKSALISVPLALCPGVARTGPGRGTAYASLDAVGELAGLVVRHLQDRRSPYRPYLEFLHDLHNYDEDTALGGDHNLDARLLEEIDVLYAGNVMHVKGVPNAPFLEKEALRTVEQRVHWVRLHNLQRRLEQSVPYFASKSVAWGISMVLSRAVEDDDQGLTLFPLIDFCSHSFSPNASIMVCKTKKENSKFGVKSHDSSVACVHLVSLKEIKAGDVLTRLFDKRGVESMEDTEYWNVRWGFVPAKDS